MAETNAERLKEITDEEYYNLMVEGYSEMANKPTIDQELEANLNRYIDGIKRENDRLRAELKTVKEDNIRLLATWDNHYSTM